MARVSRSTRRMPPLYIHVQLTDKRILRCAFYPCFAEFWQIYGAKKGKAASSGNTENAISVNVYGGLALVDNFLKYNLNRGRILADWASQKPPKGRFAPLAWLNDVCLGFCFLDGDRAPQGLSLPNGVECCPFRRHADYHARSRRASVSEAPSAEVCG